MALTKEQLDTLRAFAQDTGPFRCTKYQASELAAALTEALSLLEIAEVLTRRDFGLGTATKEARAAYVAYCVEIGSDHMAEETAILSVGREFLPPCALAVLDDRNADSVEYYEWLTEQTREAQEAHEREYAAGHEWSAEPKSMHGAEDY